MEDVQGFVMLLLPHTVGVGIRFQDGIEDEKAFEHFFSSVKIAQGGGGQSHSESVRNLWRKCNM